MQLIAAGTFVVVKGYCVPSTPGRPQIVKLVGNELTLTWSPPDNDRAVITGYCIVYTTVKGCMAQHVTAKTTTIMKLNEKIISGKSYVFAVAAKNAFVFGNFSHILEVKIPNNGIIMY